MKILYYFEDKNTFMDKWQKVHIFDELEKHDCHFIIFSPLKFVTIDEANEKLIKCIDYEKFDLFMTPYGHEKLYFETLNHIKKLGIPTLLICFDNLLIPFKHQKIAKIFDLVWLTSKETEYLFKKWGANVIFNPYAANPYFFKPILESEIERIAFIGTPYGSRVNTINSLVNNEISTTLFANKNSLVSPKKSENKLKQYIIPAYNCLRYSIGRKVFLGALKQKKYANCKLNINNYLDIKDQVAFEKLSTIHSTYALSLASTEARNTGVLKNPVNVVNLRSFEIPMSGGLQICSYFDELSEYFEEDKEIIFYRSKIEFVEKVKFYLRPENENIRRKMKASARKRAENDHTWFSRFKRAFDLLGLRDKYTN